MSTDTTVRWGILGTGRIAQTFAHDISLVPGAELAAVGSRSTDSAGEFAQAFHVPTAHSSYEALVQDDTVDVVYVATPHARHADDTMLALEAGRHVLCEKAFAMNAREAQRMVQAAREHGLFLMEAMWTRFHPTISSVRRMVRDGALGPIRTVHADISTFREPDPDDRLFDRDLGGGTLLDLGVYPIAFAFDLFGAPDTVQTSVQMGETGVDEQCAAIFSYENGLQMTWQASFRADGGRGLTLAGPDGRLQNARDWWKGTPFRHIPAEGHPQVVGEDVDGNGYQFEIAHVCNCLRDGRTESPVMTLDESIAIMQSMDDIRESWGLVYPNDKA
jgi:predicted dehydrogenase